MGRADRNVCFCDGYHPCDVLMKKLLPSSTVEYFFAEYCTGRLVKSLHHNFVDSGRWMFWTFD